MAMTARERKAKMFRACILTEGIGEVLAFASLFSWMGFWKFEVDAERL